MAMLVKVVLNSVFVCLYCTSWSTCYTTSFSQTGCGFDFCIVLMGIFFLGVFLLKNKIF